MPFHIQKKSQTAQFLFLAVKNVGV